MPSSALNYLYKLHKSLKYLVNIITIYKMYQEAFKMFYSCNHYNSCYNNQSCL